VSGKSRLPALTANQVPLLRFPTDFPTCRTPPATTQLTTALRALSAWANTAAADQRTANQATRAGAQQVAATLKRTVRLVRGDFTGTS
jgi:hypothetical protein